MDHSISGIARSAPAPSAGAAAVETGVGWVGLLGHVAPAVPAVRAGADAPTPAAGPVRSGDFGRGGRFEKFILAMQALSLDAGAASNRTDRVERMRAAAEELFGIDGMPQPVRPLAWPPASPAHAGEPKQAARGEHAEPDGPHETPETGSARPLEAGTPPIASPRAAIDPAAAIPRPEAPGAAEAASPAPSGRSATS